MSTGRGDERDGQVSLVPERNTLIEPAHNSADPDRNDAGAGRAQLLQAFEDGRQIVEDGGWPVWSPLVLTHELGSPFYAHVGCDYSFANSRYQVLVYFEDTPGWPPTAHLKIKAHDKRCVRDWRDMQRIKNEICGTEAEGVELYPEEGRVVDEVNEFHIFVLHPATNFPFGRQTRATATPGQVEEINKDKADAGKGWQREFEDHHDADGCLPRGQIGWSDWSPGNSSG